MSDLVTDPLLLVAAALFAVAAVILWIVDRPSRRDARALRRLARTPERKNGGG